MRYLGREMALEALLLGRVASDLASGTDDIVTQIHLPFVLILRIPNFLPLSSLPARSLLCETVAPKVRRPFPRRFF